MSSSSLLFNSSVVRYLLEGRGVVLDADPVEGLVGAVEGHEVADEGEVPRVDGDPVRREHAHDLADDGTVRRLDAVVPE